MTTVSWFDGDIPQLHTMLFMACEALENTKCILWNKKSASLTGTQQPCDLSTVFHLLKALQERTIAWNDTEIGLAETIRNLFAFQLRANGLNLDRNPLKKKILIYFLCCLPEMAEQTIPNKNIIDPFVEAGITDKETNISPIFDFSAGTCNCWVSTNISMSRVLKQHLQGYIYFSCPSLPRCRSIYLYRHAFCWNYPR